MAIRNWRDRVVASRMLFVPFPCPFVWSHRNCNAQLSCRIVSLPDSGLHVWMYWCKREEKRYPWHAAAKTDAGFELLRTRRARAPVVSLQWIFAVFSFVLLFWCGCVSMVLLVLGNYNSSSACSSSSSSSFCFFEGRRRRRMMMGLVFSVFHFYVMFHLFKVCQWTTCYSVHAPDSYNLHPNSTSRVELRTSIPFSKAAAETRNAVEHRKCDDGPGSREVRDLSLLVLLLLLLLTAFDRPTTHPPGRPPAWHDTRGTKMHLSRISLPCATSLSLSLSLSLLA